MAGGIIFFDTHPEVERFLVETMRQMPLFRRLQMVFSLVKTTRSLSWQGICKRYPDASEEARMRRFLYLLYGDKACRRNRPSLFYEILQ